jgi:hypothetical protein
MINWTQVWKTEANLFWNSYSERNIDSKKSLKQNWDQNKTKTSSSLDAKGKGNGKLPSRTSTVLLHTKYNTDEALLEAKTHY